MGAVNDFGPKLIDQVGLTPADFVFSDRFPGQCHLLCEW